jgi:hypothetical protein
MGEGVENIMILPLIHVNDRDCRFEGIGQTTRGVNYDLLRMSGDGLKGIITDRDPMQFLCIPPLSFLKNLENNLFIEGLAASNRRART